MNKSYDLIIVGGGTAGWILAQRLSENSQLHILLLEAGGETPLTSFVHEPALFRNTFNTEYAWQHPYTQAGKALGGSTKINACIFMRGTAADYASWPSGWNYENLLPYFKKIENCELLPAKLQAHRETRGYDGPIKLSLVGDNGKHIHPFTQCFMQASEELGYQSLNDINVSVRDRQAALHQFNIYQGQRQSVDKSYQAIRNNLTVLTHTTICQIIFDKQRAVGVKSVSGETYLTQGEIILSAGAIGTPKLMMLSGIGERNELVRHGISCIMELPVGKFMQDHIMVPLKYIANKEISKQVPVCIDSGIQASLFIRGDNCIQISMAVNPLVNRNMDALQDVPANTCIDISENGFSIIPAFSSQLSRGRVVLASNKAEDLPLVSFELYQSQTDIDTMLLALKVSRQIANAGTFTKFDLEELVDTDIPYPPHSDDYLIAYMKKHALSQAHVASTCAMGLVVDEELRVKGIENLRIVDASVIPAMINANLQCTVMAIAEKAADIMKAVSYNRISSNSFASAI